MLNFSDQIFEAIIVSVDYNNGTCSISPIDSSSSSVINEVPLPHWAGNGTAGMFYGIKTGTRVSAVFTSAKSRDVTVIVGIIPKPNLYPNLFSKRTPEDLPNSIYPYPDINEGDLVFRGERGAEIALQNDGDVLLTSVNGGGAYLKRNQAKTAFMIASEDIVSYSNAGRVVSGSVRRLSGSLGNIFPKPDLTETPLFADPDYAKKAEPLGFFTGSKVLQRSYSKKKRNPELAEYKMVINEFSTDSMFTGFDDELSRVSNDFGIYDDHETYKRNRAQANSLHLAEHELIEIIGGNLIDLNGSVLDINYNPLSYGAENNKVPTTDLEVSYDKARRISRRGIGYHFQLSTNTKADDPSRTKSNFVFDIDKEGILKVNIPASSLTGNIPYVSNTNFVGESDSVVTSYSNKSVQQPIPVTLRDENGQIVFPGKDSQAFGQGFRKTGIRFSNGEQAPYFPGENSGTVQEIRVNSTKYHDLSIAAERLIANTIRQINIPQRFVGDTGFPEGMSVLKPFEIPVPDSLNIDEGNSLDELRKVLGVGKTDFPTFMGVVAVEPGPPAMYTGGETLVAGVVYNNDSLFPAYSNSFNSVIDGKQINVNNSDGEGILTNAGGKSANINLEGSLELSIGKDNYDQKSLSLDTAGSMIAWLGKDKNDRSAIIQTDGDFLLNIGGSYKETQVMNKGRLEIRVNVTDKKFVTTQFTGDSENVNVGAESDYIISISEKGLVIAGMKFGVPMIMRNEGPILIESSSSDITLKGVQVKTVGPKGAINVIAPATRN